MKQTDFTTAQIDSLLNEEFIAFTKKWHGVIHGPEIQSVAKYIGQVRNRISEFPVVINIENLSEDSMDIDLFAVDANMKNKNIKIGLANPAEDMAFTIRELYRKQAYINSLRIISAIVPADLSEITMKTKSHNLGFSNLSDGLATSIPSESEIIRFDSLIMKIPANLPLMITLNVNLPYTPSNAKTN